MKENVYRNLRYLFTDEEKLTLSMELAKVNQEMERVKDRKKSVMADFNSTLATQQDTCSDLASKVTNGFEYRNIECEVEYHKPKRNQKTFTRIDTGEVFIDLMSDEDMTLFNQWEIQQPNTTDASSEYTFKPQTPENPLF